MDKISSNTAKISPEARSVLIMFVEMIVMREEFLKIGEDVTREGILQLIDIYLSGNKWVTFCYEDKERNEVLSILITNQNNDVRDKKTLLIQTNPISFTEISDVYNILIPF